jgi:hypothetical protein
MKEKGRVRTAVRSLPHSSFLVAAWAIACSGADARSGAAPDAEGTAPASTASAITLGQPDPGDLGVVALVTRGQSFCTGTLIARRVVLTAAHCLDATAPEEVFFGRVPTAPIDGEVSVPIMVARVHPYYDPITLAHDVALLLLRADAPAGAMPSTPLDGNIDRDLAGARIRLVGFGGGSKQMGEARLGDVGDLSFAITADPSQICDGDSGGPVFIAAGGAERLAGVSSHGSADCVRAGTAARVDIEIASFVAEFVSLTAPGEGATGSRCYADARCASGRCLFPDDAPTVGYCTASCATDMCPATMLCVDGICRFPQPSPGARGGPCDAERTCEKGVCARANSWAPLQCTDQCFADDPSSCPAGEACVANSDRAGTFACADHLGARSASCAAVSRSSRDRPNGDFTLGAGFFVLFSTTVRMRRALHRSRHMLRCSVLPCRCSLNPPGCDTGAHRQHSRPPCIGRASR